MRSQHRWLKGMYLYTAVGAGLLGLLMLLAPTWLSAHLGMPAPEPVIFGAVGSIYLAFGLLALLGLRAPLTFIPVLLLQLGYKTIWLLGVFLPQLLTGEATAYAKLFALIFLSYVIGDLIAIPFRQLHEEKGSRD